MNTPSAANENYARERAQAEEDGTALPERTDDFAPADLYHAAAALAAAMSEGGSIPPDLLQTVGLPDGDPSRWERLDVARAAAWIRDSRPDAFTDLLKRYPWLSESAENSVGAFRDAF